MVFSKRRYLTMRYIGGYLEGGYRHVEYSVCYSAKDLDSGNYSAGGPSFRLIWQGDVGAHELYGCRFNGELRAGSAKLMAALLKHWGGWGTQPLDMGIQMVKLEDGWLVPIE